MSSNVGLSDRFATQNIIILAISVAVFYLFYDSFQKVENERKQSAFSQIMQVFAWAFVFFTGYSAFRFFSDFSPPLVGSKEQVVSPIVEEDVEIPKFESLRAYQDKNERESREREIEQLQHEFLTKFRSPSVDSPTYDPDTGRVEPSRRAKKPFLIYHHPLNENNQKYVWYNESQQYVALTPKQTQMIHSRINNSGFQSPENVFSLAEIGNVFLPFSEGQNKKENQEKQEKNHFENKMTRDAAFLQEDVGEWLPVSIFRGKF